MAPEFSKDCATCGYHRETVKELANTQKKNDAQDVCIAELKKQVAVLNTNCTVMEHDLDNLGKKLNEVSTELKDAISEAKKDLEDDISGIKKPIYGIVMSVILLALQAIFKIGGSNVGVGVIQ